jgi:hypothetical protein
MGISPSKISTCALIPILFPTTGEKIGDSNSNTPYSPGSNIIV